MWHFKNIPKVAHFYWSGNILPYLRYFTILSFKKLNPDWEIHLHSEEKPWRENKTPWTLPEQKIVFTKGKDYFEEAIDLCDQIHYHNFINTNANTTHAAIKSDLLRWQLLAEQGGLWSDLDIIYNYSIDNLLENCIQNENISSTICKTNYYSIGFLLSSPNDSFYRDLWKKASETTPNQYQSLGSILQRKIFNSKYNKVLNLNTKCVYPIVSNSILPDLVVKNNKTDLYLMDKNIIGYHWFGGMGKAIELYEKFENNSFPPDSIIGYIRNKNG